MHPDVCTVAAIITLYLNLLRMSLKEERESDRVTIKHEITDENTNTNNCISNNIGVHLVPVSLPPRTFIVSQPQPFQYLPMAPPVQPNLAQSSMIPTANLVPITMQQPYIPIPHNPSLPIPPPPSACALNALQQSLKTRQDDTIKTETLPPLPHALFQYPQTHNPQYLPPQSRKDEVLNENWSAKVAYAATLSSIINETAKLYREKSELHLKPKWSDLLYKLNSDSSKQKVYDEAIDYIFKKSELFLMEISSTMSGTKITESIGMMKGLTDAICNLIKIASIHLPGCNRMKMQHLFENKMLIMWCSLLLRATTDVRQAMQRYLTHTSFKPYFWYRTALKNQFYKHLTSDEKLLIKLRTKKEQNDFEAQTRKYVEEVHLSLMSMRQISILPHHDRMNNMNHNKRRNDDFSCPKPPKKRRKKSRYQLFRVDGTPRKRQHNPCDRRICKRMWQSDGVTKGCGQNSHPRGVCPCWKQLGFAKKDEKDGNILKWLEDKYGKKK
eukprot:454116_1